MTLTGFGSVGAAIGGAGGDGGRCGHNHNLPPNCFATATNVIAVGAILDRILYKLGGIANPPATKPVAGDGGNGGNAIAIAPEASAQGGGGGNGGNSNGAYTVAGSKGDGGWALGNGTNTAGASGNNGV